MYDVPAVAWAGLFDLESDHANIRAALGWLVANDPIGYVRMTGPLGMYWYQYGHLGEGRRWLDGALTIAAGLGEALPATAHASALIGAGLILQMQGDLTQARASFERALARTDAAGDRWRATIARSLLGGVLVSEGRYDEAEPLFDDALARWQALGHQVWVVHALFHLGLIAYTRRDWDRAVQLLTEAVRLYDAHGAELESSDPLHYLALIACERGDITEAAGIIADILRRLRQRGSGPYLADGLADVATLAAVRGDGAVSARFFGAAARLLETAGGTYSLPGRDTYERAQATARQHLTEETWRTAFVTGRALPLDQALAEAEAMLTPALEGTALP